MKHSSKLVSRETNSCSFYIKSVESTNNAWD
jgi:hypothetical protein